MTHMVEAPRSGAKSFDKFESIHQTEVSRLYSAVQRQCWQTCMRPLTARQRRNRPAWLPFTPPLPPMNVDTPESQKECIETCVAEFFDVMLVRRCSC